MLFLIASYNLYATQKSITRREAQLKKKLDGVKLHKEIDSYYLSCLHDWCQTYIKAEVENAMYSPIELTHEEIEKAFGHRVRIVSEKPGENA